MSCVIHAQTLPANLVSNPSFESPGSWSSWIYSGSADINYRDSREALFGSYSGSIEKCTGEVIIQHDRFNLDNSSDLIFSGWIKTDFTTASTGANYRLIWYDNANQYLSIQDYGTPLQGKNDWTFVSFHIPAASIPENATNVILACLVNNGSADERGVAFFDGISLSRASQLTRPPTPDLNSSYAYGETRLTWTAQEGFEYLIYEGSKSDFAVNVGAFNYRTTSGNLIFTDYEQKTKYYRVVAVNENFIPSNPSSAVKGDTNPPETVTDLTCDDSLNGVVILRWTVPEAASDGDLPAGYIIYRLKQPVFSEANIEAAVNLTARDPEFKGTPGAAIEYWYTAPGDREYYYAVRALDDALNPGEPSNLVSGWPASDLVRPNGPVQPRAYAQQDDQNNPLPHGLVLLKWRTPEAAEDGDMPRYFIILRGVRAPDNMQQLAQIRTTGSDAPGTAYQWADVTATEGVPYYYKIISVDKAGNKSQYDPLLVAEPLKPFAPQGLTPASGAAVYLQDAQVLLAWEPVHPVADTVASYTVQYSRSEAFQAEIVELSAVEEPESLLSLENLSAGIWYWRIKTQFASGVVSYSQASKLAVIDLQAAAAEQGAISYAATSQNVIFPGEGTTLLLVPSAPATIWVRVYNSKGKRVASLAEGEVFPAEEEILLQWNGKDSRGRTVSEGLYFIQIKAHSAAKPSTTITKRVQVVK